MALDTEKKRGILQRIVGLFDTSKRDAAQAKMYKRSPSGRLVGPKGEPLPIGAGVGKSPVKPASAAEYPKIKKSLYGKTASKGPWETMRESSVSSGYPVPPTK